MSSKSQRKRSPIFTDDQGNPICVFIHSSINEQHKIDKLTKDIENYGGRVIDSQEGVDTVLVDKGKANRAGLQLVYGCSTVPGRSSIWIEPPKWVRDCIKSGYCSHSMPKRKGMGGGPQRKRFTEEEDEKLCEYIAKRIPNYDAGGRRGDGIFIDLEMMGNASEQGEEFYWARRHTWQSWRNRFNKNFERLNPKVDEIARRLLPSEIEAYHLDRRLNRRVPKLDFEEDEEEDEESNLSSDVDLPAAGARQQRYTIEEEQPIRKARRPKAKISQKRKNQRKAHALDSEEESDEDLPRAHTSNRRESPLFSEDEGHVSPLFSDVEEAEGYMQPVEQAKMQLFHPDDDYDPVLGNDFDFEPLEGPNPYQHRLADSDDLPAPSQAFLSSQKTLVEQPISTKRIPSSISRRRPQSQQSPAQANMQPGPSRPSSARRRDSHGTPLKRGVRPDVQPSSALSQPTALPLPARDDDQPSPARLLPVSPALQVQPSPVRSQPASPSRKALDDIQSSLVRSQPVSPARQALSSRKSAAVKVVQRPEKPASRKRKASTPPQDAPSRNTRARSRSVSVEPLATLPPPRKRKKQPELRPVIESPQAPPPEEPFWDDYQVDDEEALPPIEQNQVASAATSNQVDEMDVQDQLVPETVFSDASQSTMDTDDAQIDAALRQRDGDEPTSQFPTSFYGPVDSVLAKFEASLTNTMNPSKTGGSSLRIPQPFFQSSAPSSLRETTFSFSPSAGTVKAVTPRRQLSSSSAETFPIPGTRASAVKERIQEIEKSTPYKPPAGTKAARFRERAEQAEKSSQKRVLRPRQK